MAWQWTLWSLPGFVCLLVGWTLGPLIYRTRPDRLQNRALAAVVVLEGTTFGALAGLRNAFTDAPGAAGAYMVVFTAGILGFVAYVYFLSTIDSSLAAPLRRRAVRAVAVVVLAASIVVRLARPELTLANMEPNPVTGGWEFPATVFDSVTWFLPATLFLLYALAIAVSAWRRAPEGIVRDQMRSYALAFGWRDGLTAAMFLLIGAGAGALTPFAEAALFSLGWAALYLGFAALLTYGILRTQVFDIDLKVKAGLERSTVVAVFAVVFLVVSEAVERVLNVEGLLFGLLAAVAIGLVFRRVERLGEAVADRLMPDVEETDAYLVSRKHEVYRHAAEEAVVDGVISNKERRVLAALKEDLGIRDDVAQRLERDATGRGEVGAG